MGRLDEESVRAVQLHWARIVQEVAAEPVARPVTYPVPFVSDIRRERRNARRAMARIAAAGRRAQVIELRPAAGRVVEFGGEAA